jgi:hypothetical protein
MYPRDGLTQAAIAVSRALNALAYGVIEDEYPVGTSRSFDQPFRFRIVDVPDLVLVIEVLYRTFLPNEREPSRSSETVSLIGRTSWIGTPCGSGTMFDLGSPDHGSKV